MFTLHDIRVFISFTVSIVTNANATTRPYVQRRLTSNVEQTTQNSLHRLFGILHRLTNNTKHFFFFCVDVSHIAIISTKINSTEKKFEVIDRTFWFFFFRITQKMGTIAYDLNRQSAY